MEKKKTLGRRKIDMKKIEKTSSRQVTFSKRRIGLFKKAAELSIMTGAEVGIIVQSLGGQAVYSFGYPNIENLLNRYTTPTLETRSQPTGRLDQAMKEYEEVANALEEEKKKKKLVEERRRVKNADMWGNENPDTLGFEQLEEYTLALEKLKENVMMRSEYLKLLEKSTGSTSEDLHSDLVAQMVNYDDLTHDDHIDYADFFSELPCDFNLGDLLAV